MEEKQCYICDSGAARESFKNTANPIVYLLKIFQHLWNKIQAPQDGLYSPPCSTCFSYLILLILKHTKLLSQAL